MLNPDGFVKGLAFAARGLDEDGGRHAGRTNFRCPRREGAVQARFVLKPVMVACFDVPHVDM